MIRSATDLLVEGGPWAVTVDAVVARSGVAKSTIYRHWESRDELLVEILASCAPEIGTPAPELGAADAFARSCAASPPCCAIPNTGARCRCCSCSSRSSRVRPTSRKSSRPTSSRSSTTCSRAGVREGVLRDGIDPHLVAALLFGPMLFAHLTDMVPLTDEFADELVDAFIAGHGVER